MDWKRRLRKRADQYVSSSFMLDIAVAKTAETLVRSDPLPMTLRWGGVALLALGLHVANARAKAAEVAEEAAEQVDEATDAAADAVDEATDGS